ncbi:MAG: aspartyl-phosphate phosphatase Spo0E family protein [Clostridiaceae bacterium]
MNELKDNIESLREKLYQLIEENELTDVNVLRCSQELDIILAEYEKNKIYSEENLRTNDNTH